MSSVDSAWHARGGKRRHRDDLGPRFLSCANKPHHAKTVRPHHNCPQLYQSFTLEPLYSLPYESLFKMSGSKVFSAEGKGLKLTTAEDIEPHIQDLKANDDVEEVRFLGNTLGVEASEALAKVLETKKTLKVCQPAMKSPFMQGGHD